MPLFYAAEFCDMTHERLPETPGEQHRYRIPNLLRRRNKATFKDEVVWKRLESSGFSDADSAVLLRVPESAVRQADASCCQGTRRAILVHPTVNVAVAAGLRSVTLEHQLWWPIKPSPARWSGRDSAEVGCREASGLVIRNIRMCFSRFQWRKISNPLPDRAEGRAGGARAVSVLGKPRRAQEACHHDETLSVLRHAEFLSSHKPKFEVVAAAPEETEEPLKWARMYRASLKARNVLNKDERRAEPLNHGAEVVQEAPPAVSNTIVANPAKWLTGRAATKQQWSVTSVLQRFSDARAGVLYSIVDELRLWEVPTIGSRCINVTVDANDDLHAGLAKAEARSSTAREEIDYLNWGPRAAVTPSGSHSVSPALDQSRSLHPRPVGPRCYLSFLPSRLHECDNTR